MRVIVIALGLILAVARPCGAAETLITILTSTPSGIWHSYGVTLSSIYDKAMPGANVTVQATAASVENLRLLEAGDGELGFTNGDALAEAWAGNKEAGFDAPLRKLRAVANLYPQFLQIVASDRSGANTLADLKGKHVSLGPEGSATALEAVAIFQADGFTAGDLKDFVRASFTQSFRRVGEGTLDAAVQSGALGTGNVRDTLGSGRARLIPIPAEVVAKVGNPVYVPATIPAGTYDGQPADIPTFSVPTFLVTRMGVTDQVAYTMTKSLFDHLDQLVQTDPAAKNIDIKKAATGLPIPLHPGAERYYREVGLVK